MIFTGKGIFKWTIFIYAFNLYDACSFLWQAILDSTVLQRDRFCAIVEAQDNLRIVEMPNWAGLGVVQ